jgi:hypothetical protein
VQFRRPCQRLGGSRLVTTFCTEFTSHSPPPPPLLPALTPSAGELEVSRTGGGLPPYSTRSSLEAQNSRPHFLAAFSRLLSRCHGGATGVLFRAHGPPPLPARQGVSIGTAGCACLGFVVRYLFNHRRPSYTISAGPPPSWQTS